MKPNRKKSQQGVALVVTVIVVAMLAVVAVAMMQSTSVDRLSSRSVANYYRAQLAAQSGLAEAMALIQQNANNFAYISGAEPSGDGYRTFIRPLTEAGGSWKFAGGDDTRVYLDSGDGEGARFILTGTTEEPGLEQTAAWKEMATANAKPYETNRYAFWVDDGSAKQNLAWWGGGAAPAEGSSLTNLAQITPFIGDLSGQSPEALADGTLKKILEARTLSLTNFELDELEFDSVRSDTKIPTVATINLLDPELEGRINSAFFTVSSASGATTPKGAPKLNLAALAKHVQTLNTEQGAESAKAKLVEDLLKAEPEGAPGWGGGSLSWLSETSAAGGLPKYTEAEQKQIVANIIDYLDDDLIPTTDSVDSPTYFGVEFKLTEDGKVRGHPFINFVGLGSVFNWKRADPEKGRLNSTRVLAFLGLVNPWSLAIPTSLDTYTPEIIVDIEGTVTGGSLGESAAAYFETQVDQSLTPQTQELQPRTGATFPGPASGNNYANVKDFFGAGAPEKPGIQFTELEYKVRSMKLKFTSDDGLEGYVQVLADLSTRMSPELVAFKDKTPDVYKLTRDSPEQEDLHLNGDPRKNYTKSSWLNSKSSGGNSADIPEPQSAIDIFSDAGNSWDKAQSLPSGFAWYKNEAVKNHFNRGSDSGMSSIGELGYIWTGKPWQTLNLLATDEPETADWNLLDYVAAGRMASAKPGAPDAGEGEDGTVVPTLPLGAVDAGAPMVGGLVASGGFNVNTRKLPTLAAVLSAMPGYEASAADQLVEEASGSQASAYGEIAALAAAVPELVKGNNKFEREGLQRALANIAVHQSRIFTVYAAGEYRQGNNVSRAQLEADVFVGVDAKTGLPKLQIIRQKYL